MVNYHDFKLKDLDLRAFEFYWNVLRYETQNIIFLIYENIVIIWNLHDILLVHDIKLNFSLVF